MCQTLVGGGTLEYFYLGNVNKLSRVGNIFFLSYGIVKNLHEIKAAH